MELSKTETSKTNTASIKGAQPFFSFGQSPAPVSFFQPKLTVNQPNDIYEQEADAMAEKVMRMTGPAIQKKCASCEQEDEKNVQLKPAATVQKQDEADLPASPPATPTSSFQLPVPSLLQPSTQPDFLAMRQPFFQRNIPHSFDASSALQVWNYNFDFFRRFGLVPGMAASASNFTAPFAIDSQLKAGNPTWWEISDRDMGTTTYNASLPILDFNADFTPTAPSWFKTLFSGGSPSVQRKCDECEAGEENKVQLKENGGQAQTSDGFENYVGGLDSSGEQLPADVRSFYEPRFGYDFSNVKIHKDTAAAASAKSINALAYTTGTNIVFGDGKYDPGNDSGKRLLGHELTHVVQQSTINTSVQADLAVDLPAPGVEAPVLTDEEMADAIRYNTRRFNLRDEWEISLVRDVLGLDKLPAVVDEDLVNAIAGYQAENAIRADGKIGAVTASRLSRELFNEGRDLPAADRRELLRSSRRMGTRALRIRVNQPAAALDNLGSANYGVMWEVADREANGFVIQHVVITGNLQDCAGNAVAMNGFAGNRDYWEVWRVVNGRVRCGTLAVACTGSDDTFTTVSQNAGTRGTIRERGQVSYYPDYLLNADWITGITHPAGDLPHRATRPPFWNESETLRHEMNITYDDCATPAVNATVTSTP